MSRALTVHLERPITLIKVLNNYGVDAELSGHGRVNSAVRTDHAKLTQDLKAQKTEVLQTCQTLKELVDKLNKFYTEAFSGHKEEIARLAVEIAGKILMQDVEKGNYKIETIVKEALKNVPTRQDVVVHLNPEDLDTFQKLQQDELDKIGTLDGMKFIADSNIGRAECLVDSPKGIIESLIDEHLKRIAEALKKVK